MMNPTRSLFFRKTGDGIPVVILHGLFGMADNWQSFAKYLAEQGFAVYTVDLRNHGQSFHDPLFNYQVMAEDVENLFLHENIKNPVLMGHSMGGKVAMQLALSNPAVISGLIVIDIAPRFYPVHHYEVIEALKSLDLSQIKSRKEAEVSWKDNGLDTATKQFLLKNLYWKIDVLDWRFNLPVIEKEIDEIGMEISSGNTFDKPALFIRGENSKYITEEDTIQIKILFPNAEIKTALASGHWVNADNPAWLLTNVIEFLKITMSQNNMTKR
jgi:esterase